MLDFYIDDSYSSGDVPAGTGVFVLAGWIGFPKEWDRFEANWRDNVITKAPRPITRLHMSSLENPVEKNRGEFQGWTRAEQNQLMTLAVDALLDEHVSSLFGAAVAIDIGAGRSYGLVELFSTALYHLVLDAFRFCHYPVEGLQFAYEADNEQFWPALQGAVKEIKSWLALYPEPILTTVFTESGYQPMPVTSSGLQSADLLAYEIKRRVELRAPRTSYQRIIDGRPHVFRRSSADVDGRLPILGLPSHTFDPVSRNYIFRNGENVS